MRRAGRGGVVRARQSTAERGRFVSHAELGLGAVGTARRLHDELALGLVGVRFGALGGVRLVVLGEMRLGAFDLDKALAADELVAAARLVEKPGVVHAADGALDPVLVEEDLELLTVHPGVMRQADFPRPHVLLGPVARRDAEGSSDGLVRGLQLARAWQRRRGE